MSSRSRDVVIFDLGDVLFTWSQPSQSCLISHHDLRRILNSAPWFEYEKGSLTEHEIYSLISREHGLSLSEVDSTFQALRESLQKNSKMFDIVREFKKSGHAIYAMSNISAPDWAVLYTKATPKEWSLFDDIFISASMHERKPNIGFYKHVIEESGIDPTHAIFVDDKIENVLAARSFGMYGIVFDGQPRTMRELTGRNLCYDPVVRGRGYLYSHKKKLSSYTSNGASFYDNFSQFLILEATGDESLVEYDKISGRYNFFMGGPVLSTKSFPDDFDTTSLAFTVGKHIDKATMDAVMDDILEYRSSDGIIQVYFNHSRPRIDPAVCVNVLTMFYQHGRGDQLSETLDWVEQVLINRAYVAGTYYYLNADLFLFFLSRTLRVSDEVRGRLCSAFKERIIERFGVEADALALACRILAATTVGILDEFDLQTLLSMQQEDGYETFTCKSSFF